MRDIKLVNYCNTRIKSYNMLYKAISENTDNYKDSLEIYNKEIEVIIKSLSEN